MSLRDEGKTTKLSSFKSLKDCAEVFKENLREVIDDEINLDGTSAMSLTGGSDTRVLLSIMSTEQKNKLTFFTFDTPYWSNYNNDLSIAKLIVKKLNLRHEILSFKPSVKGWESLPQGFLETYYSLKHCHSISGMCGTELFGGKFFNNHNFEHYAYGKNTDQLRINLLDKLISFSDYRRIGSPWSRLNKKILSVDSASREAAFMVQILFRSQFTSMYSYYNVNAFIIPYMSHFKKYFPLWIRESLMFFSDVPENTF